MRKKKHETLNGWDYVNRSSHELMNHPDFSPHALRTIAAVMRMTTKQLEQLNVIGGKD